MRAKLIKVAGNVAIVLVITDLPVAYAIGVEHVRGIRVNEEFEISEDVIDSGTEYSVDWEVVIPEGLYIPAFRIHELLINRGILTFDDYRNKQREVQDTLNIFIGELRVQLSNKVKEIGG